MSKNPCYKYTPTSKYKFEYLHNINQLLPR